MVEKYKPAKPSMEINQTHFIDTTFKVFQSINYQKHFMLTVLSKIINFTLLKPV